MEDLIISFSGGRTSGYMTKRILDEYSDQYNIHVTFANTGLEHPKTLEFVNNCDKYFGFNTVWLECVVHNGEKKASTHKVVDFETASRAGEPFEQYIKKYGIPNVAFPSCTRELKLNPMKAYIKSIGVDFKKTPTAIGIRIDEDRRAKPSKLQNLVYPLVDWWPTDKSEILYWWRQQEFDLGIEEFEGNCLGCFKKSTKKLLMQIDKDPSVFDFHRRVERLYKNVGPQDNIRVFFRGNLDTNGLFSLYDMCGQQLSLFPETPEELNGGCTESCELFEME